MMIAGMSLALLCGAGGLSHAGQTDETCAYSAEDDADIPVCGVVELTGKHPLDTDECPKTWDFETFRKVTRLPVDDVRDYRNLNDILIGPELRSWPHAELNVIPNPTYKYDNEPSSYQVKTNGYITYDTFNPYHAGRHPVTRGNVRVLRLKNRNANFALLLATGLAHSSPFPLHVTGDGLVDVVYLDGCLQWEKIRHVPKENAHSHARWELRARDKTGGTRTVFIDDGIRLRLIPRHRVLAWSKDIDRRSTERYDAKVTKVRDLQDARQRIEDEKRAIQEDVFENFIYVEAPYLRSFSRTLDIDAYLKRVEGRYYGELGTAKVMSLRDDPDFFAARIEGNVRSQVRGLISKDVNSDGVLTPDEIESEYNGAIKRNENNEKILKTLAPLNERLERIQKYDKNGDGMVSFDEMRILPDDKMRHYGDRLKKMQEDFRVSDANGDGIVEIGEVRARARVIFDFMDISKDGIVSREEEKAYRDKMEIMSRVDGQIRKFKRIYQSFLEKYDALPGDFPEATRFLSDCTTDMHYTCGNGNGDGIVGSSEPSPVAPIVDERHLFWVHVHMNNRAAFYKLNNRSMEWNKTFPGSPVGGGLHVYYYDGKRSLPEFAGNTNPVSGHYLWLSDDIDGDFKGEGRHFLTPSIAYVIDKEMDDGFPLTGDVIAAGDRGCIKEDGNEWRYDIRLTPSLKPERKCLSLFFYLGPAIEKYVPKPYVSEQPKPVPQINLFSHPDD